MEISVKNQLEDILSEYSDEVNEVVEEEIEKEARALVERLKSDSPKKSGKYAKSWKVYTISNERSRKSKLIYNEKGQLTHLLENGHVTRNGKTRTKAYPHILKNEELSKRLLPKRISERIER